MTVTADPLPSARSCRWYRAGGAKFEVRNPADGEVVEACYNPVSARGRSVEGRPR